jgi:hypothetical protein
MSEITNSDLLVVLNKISSDVGELKGAADLHLKAIENHGTRIKDLENDVATQKGAARVWGSLSATAGVVGGILATLIAGWWGKH